MAEGTTGVQVLKTPPATGDSTAAYAEHGVSDVTNRNTVVRPPSNQQTARPMMMEGNQQHNANNTPYANNYNNAYNTYHSNNNNTYSNNQYFNQYSNNNNQYYGGGGGYYNNNREYNNSNNYNNPNAFNKAPNVYTPPAAAEVGDGSVVDSALLAALRDSRERVALLRLEQVMIDFMNAPEGYLEVGGPYNSVVVSPNTSSKRFQSAASVGTDTGGRQTSFQRCLLHRLADRFGIVRESGTILEGSIRLIKQKDSKIPKVLLLDHMEDVNKNEGSKGGDAEAITSGMDDLKVSAQGATAGAAPPKDKSKRKMKIMKRNSSAESGNGQTKSTPKSRKNKNFSDKEKAYAEARARIFADEAANNASAAAGTTTSSSGQTQSAPPSMAPSPSATPPPAPITSQTSPSSNPNNNASSQPPSGAATPVHKSGSANSLNLPKRMSSSSLAAEAEDTPAAAQSGVSKATWRNRKEEENDPDFQRGAGLQTLVPVAAAPTYNVPIAGNAYYYQAGGAPAAYGQPTAYYGDAQQHYNAGRGRGFVARGYYPQQQQHQQHYQQPQRGNNGEATDVNCMEEFPALR